MIYELNEEDRKRSMESKDLRDLITNKVCSYISDEGEIITQIPQVNIIRRNHPTLPTAYFYEPSLAIIASGRKRVILGEQTYIYDASRFLLTSLDLPTTTEVIDASPKHPYISIFIKLDLISLRRLLADVGKNDVEHASQEAGMATGPANKAIFDAVNRLLSLLDTPKDIPHLAPLIMNEIYYRILVSSAGAHLRQIISRGTQSNRTTKAIHWMRENFSKPFKLQEISEIAGMATSTFNHHFRELTSMSPLQYQKQLRLHEARRIMISEEIDANTAAFRVGYESVTQFNREYRRQFGEPPMRDIKSLRLLSEK